MAQAAFDDSTRASHELTGRLGPFRLLKQLGEGGMAVVYRARRETATGMTRDVVVKAMLPQLTHNATLVQMFEAEARLTAQLRHPNIVCVEDYGVDHDMPYLVMEYLDGKNLSQLRGALRKTRRTMPVAVAVAIARDLCRALGYAHDFVAMDGQRMQIVHRDVSPSNVMLQHDGSVKLLDFGVAKLLSIASQAVTSSLKGKFAYMSPEQVEQQPIDRRCDVFAAGIVLHEMLTGERLFGTRDERETLRRVAAAHVHPPSARNAAVSEALDAVVLRALSRKREDRFASGREMAEALEALGMAASRRELVEFLDSVAPEERPTAQQIPVVDGRIETFQDGQTDQEVVGATTTPGNTQTGPRLLLIEADEPTPCGQHSQPSVVYSGEIEILEGPSLSGVPSLSTSALEEVVESVSAPQPVGVSDPQLPTRRLQAVPAGPNPFEDFAATDVFRRARPGVVRTGVTPALVQAVLEPLETSQQAPRGGDPCAIVELPVGPAPDGVVGPPQARVAAVEPASPTRRSRRWVAIVGGVALGLVAAFIGVRIQARRHPAAAGPLAVSAAANDVRRETSAVDLTARSSRRATELAAPVSPPPVLVSPTLAAEEPTEPRSLSGRDRDPESSSARDPREGAREQHEPKVWSRSSSHVHVPSSGHRHSGASAPASVRDGRIVNPFDA